MCAMPVPGLFGRILTCRGAGGLSKKERKAGDKLRQRAGELALRTLP